MLDIDLSEPAPLSEADVRAFWRAMCRFPQIRYQDRYSILKAYEEERAKPDWYKTAPAPFV